MKTLVTICLLFCMTACSGEKKETITVSGSTTVLPVVSMAAEQFSTLKGNLRIMVNAGGSGVGINQLGEGKIDIGMISRDITDAERKRHSNVRFVEHPIGKDAVVPVISSEVFNVGVTTLTLAQIRDIYLGKIQNWKGVGGPDREILVIDKEHSRGTRHVFMKAVMGDKEALAPGADLVLGSNNEEQTAVTQSDSAIGMLSHAWLNDDVKGVSILLADGSSIEPTLENIVNGSFPITRDLLIITNGNPSGRVKEFIDYILGLEGQKIVKEAGYVSLNQ